MYVKQISHQSAIVYILSFQLIPTGKQRNRDRSEELIRELDRDIATMLDEELNNLDHNADKKSVPEEVSHLSTMFPSSETHRALEPVSGAVHREMRALSIDSADTVMESASVACHRVSSSEMNLNTDLDRLSQLGSQTAARDHQRPEILPCLKPDFYHDASPADFTAELPTISRTETSGAAKLTLRYSDDDRSHRPSSYCRSPILPCPELPVINVDKMNGEKEMHILKFAALQLSAVKALSVLASCEKFVELLLIPRSCSNEKTNEKQLFDSINMHRNEDLKAALRQMMKLFVSRSTFPSPFKRAVPLAEIERSFTVLHSSVIQHITEEKLGVSSLEGRHCCHIVVHVKTLKVTNKTNVL